MTDGSRTLKRVVVVLVSDQPFLNTHARTCSSFCEVSPICKHFVYFEFCQKSGRGGMVILLLHFPLPSVILNSPISPDPSHCSLARSSVWTITINLRLTSYAGIGTSCCGSIYKIIVLCMWVVWGPMFGLRWMYLMMTSTWFERLTHPFLSLSFCENNWTKTSFLFVFLGRWSVHHYIPCGLSDKVAHLNPCRSSSKERLDVCTSPLLLHMM